MEEFIKVYFNDDVIYYNSGNFYCNLCKQYIHYNANNITVDGDKIITHENIKNNLLECFKYDGTLLRECIYSFVKEYKIYI
jgi:hypothetical protein